MIMKFKLATKAACIIINFGPGMVLEGHAPGELKLHSPSGDSWIVEGKMDDVWSKLVPPSPNKRNMGNWYWD